MPVGLVCPRCDALTGLDATRCPVCQAPIVEAGSRESLPAPAQPAVSVEESMSTKPCPTCGNPVPIGDRFCGQCGTRIEIQPQPSASGGKTMFFSGVQVSSVAKLVVVKANSADGLAYELGGTEHVVGRSEGAILFPDDPLVSPRHANFFYRDGKLFVRDENSINGVFVRIRTPTRLDSGSVFLVGEQLLQVEALAPDFGPQPDAEGTYFYASPRRASKMRIVQRLRGGELGLIVRARGDSITIGREDNDLNFPDDPFISGRHAEVGIGPDGTFTVTDLSSKNGTFVRITDESPLGHGDYVFLGQQLMRVEIS
ncbi:MAG: FHA domain-containing protein [Polyangia bacterium]|jgi:pSer/pThr/pTyr-binding forkhead associated (FHA) protein/RNA polymerase subunit RPABC4/transcription elongation factor Spt4